MSIGQKTTAWTRRQALWLITGATGGLVLHDRAQKADATSSQSPQSTETASTKPVSAASESTLGNGYTPLHIALEKGYFKEGDLNLIYRDFSSGTDANAAFGGGRLEGQSLVTSEAESLAAIGVDYQILMAADIFFGGDGILLSERCHWRLLE